MDLQEENDDIRLPMECDCELKENNLQEEDDDVLHRIIMERMASQG